MLAQIESSFNAQAKSEAKMRRFVGDASHELRTPLVSIRGYSELYRQGALPNDEAVATAMGRIEAESKRMGQLVGGSAHAGAHRRTPRNLSSPPSICSTWR